MPRLILACLVLAALFCILCGPVSYVALRLRRRGDGGALRPLRTVWIVQVALAGGLLFAADTLEVENPAAIMTAIVLGVSVVGAALFGAWRIATRALAR